MYELKDIKVTLLNPEEVKNFIRNHGIVACVCYDTDEKYAEKVGAPYLFVVGEDDYLSVKNLIGGDYVETTVEDFLENRNAQR